MAPRQQLLFKISSDTPQAGVAEAVQTLALGGGVAARGAVFTRSEVVEFLLDLVGYTTDKPLYEKRLLEPSFGGGDFLLPAIERLLTSWKIHNKNQVSNDATVKDLSNAIYGVELHSETFATTQSAICEKLRQRGLSAEAATSLTNNWLRCDDFLLAPISEPFDFVVGNPPYVRQELIPAPLLAEYRNRYQTIYDRADLYIPFIERSLGLLDQNGHLGFICADRWMKNQYGAPLRQLVAEKFHLKVYVDMVDTQAFHSDVIAYPAITVISKSTPGKTRFAKSPTINQEALAALAKELNQAPEQVATSQVATIQVTDKNTPWLFETNNHLDLIRRLEQAFPTLEDAGCKVGIGVATGADKAFIGEFDKLDVEPDRKLPLVTTSDIDSGKLRWQGLGVINPFNESGGLVDLSSYPRLNQYLQTRREIIASRHCAKKNPVNWYRTIDRINPLLAATPKLLIPDIKGDAHIVFEPGALYPHHNLYHITSQTWDLLALRAVLLSGIARLFVSAYSTKMRGGYLRFQAQYLRRIRLPRWNDVPSALQAELISAANDNNLDVRNQAVSKLYHLNEAQQALLQRTNVSCH